MKKKQNSLLTNTKLFHVCPGFDQLELCLKRDTPVQLHDFAKLRMPGNYMALPNQERLCNYLTLPN